MFTPPSVAEGSLSQVSFGIRKYFATAGAFGMLSMLVNREGVVGSALPFSTRVADEYKRVGGTWLRSLGSEGQLVKFV